MRRSPLEGVEMPPAVARGIRVIFGADLSAAEVVSRIVDDVRRRGDQALLEWTKRLDGVDLERLEVSHDALVAAYDHIPEGLVEALRMAAQRIDAFHRQHVPRSWVDFSTSGTLGQIVTPLERVAIYAPGGRAAYPSSILMQVIPAKVAGVKDVVVVSPPSKDGVPAAITRVACHIAGADRVFAVGGAQAVAAVAYGTETIPRVDKVLGPGNIFVSLAKKQVFGTVSIDQVAGPTETIVIADGTARAEVVAMDLLAQAEHDPLASAILITTSVELARQVQKAVEDHLTRLSTAQVATESLARNGAIIVVNSLETAVGLANEYAPEHLCLETSSPWSLLPLVKHAGGVFVGEDSPEVLGDYIAGPSHVMPTGGTARFFSPLNSADFVKVSSLVGIARPELGRIGPAAAAIADAEGLVAHAEAIRIRLEQMDKGETHGG